jgi:hypothetical protein
VTNLHGRCETHESYGLTCCAFDRLRARADDRCEICGIPGVETPHGILNIDHEGLYGPTAHVRGLLCSRCNTWLGRCEGSNRRDTHRTLSDLQQAYLSNPFWRDPDHPGLTWARATQAKRLVKTADMLRAGVRGATRDPMDRAISDAVVATAKRHGMRSREIAAIVGIAEDKVSRMDRRFRAVP